MPLELHNYSNISKRIASHISLYILNRINTLSNLKKIQQIWIIKTHAVKLSYLNVNVE